MSPMIYIEGVEVSWLGHDGFKLTDGELTVAIDPFRIVSASNQKADVLFITHEHFDHCSPKDIAQVISPETVIVAPPIAEDCLSVFPNEKVFVAPFEEGEVVGVKFRTVPAYNVNKFRAPGVVFHPKEDGRVGYVFELGGVTFYHAGDTDVIPEMAEVVTDVAMLPVSGVYVMTAEEAAEALKIIKGVQVAIPMHWGTIVGSIDDALRFKELAEALGVKVVVPEREPW
ncbi:Zn-dependent hydrolase of the beta-lactamase fold-like protein [Ignicoccus hospitalis KIN4/I]|uniref:Zn-dependent hydrolase of the beta-lactamase fold-like protein n=2 Tax=Ignicoccus TaxID=54258 RepID=A8A8L1_IGNH4|nr:Zn-dependent hydrolase of the beta-lactamase fold-like protein [Ignicoccus hospitalis KIN4/I]